MTIDVPDGVLNLSRELQSNVSELDDIAAKYISDAYKHYIVTVGAVDTGELLYSVHVEEAPGGVGQYRKYVVASAAHAMVVEMGWTERGKGQESYPGRFPAQKAIEYVLGQLQSGELVDALKWRLGK